MTRLEAQQQLQGPATMTRAVSTRLERGWVWQRRSGLDKQHETTTTTATTHWEGSERS